MYGEVILYLESSYAREDVTHKPLNKLVLARFEIKPSVLPLLDIFHLEFYSMSDIGI